MPARSGPAQAPARPYVVSAALIAVPWVALLAIPLYARKAPVVLGLPMFYWWTFVWIVLLAAATAASYRIIEQAKAAAAADAGVVR